MRVQIYYLKCPDTLEIRYVGRTKNKLNIRLNGHLSKARKSPDKTNHKNNWLKKLLLSDKRPIIELVECVEGWEESYKREKEIIKKLLSENIKLVNSDDRGEGGINKIISPEQRKQISKTLKSKYTKGLKVATSIPLYVYDMDGFFVRGFETMRACAKWLKISDKHIQNSMRRNSRRLHSYQIRKFKTDKIDKYINPRYGTPMPD